jgi:DNA replication protein DnaC
MGSSRILPRRRTTPAELARLDRFNPLILDDFSYVRRDQAESSALFELITERYERKRIALTASQPFSAWDQVFPEAARTIVVFGQDS